MFLVIDLIAAPFSPSMVRYLEACSTPQSNLLASKRDGSNDEVTVILDQEKNSNGGSSSHASHEQNTCMHSVIPMHFQFSFMSFTS